MVFEILAADIQNRGPRLLPPGVTTEGIQATKLLNCLRYQVLAEVLAAQITVNADAVSSGFPDYSDGCPRRNSVCMHTFHATDIRTSFVRTAQPL